MNAAPFAQGDARRTDVERSVAALVLALALARDALTAGYPDDPDPLCPCIYAMDSTTPSLATAPSSTAMTASPSTSTESIGAL